MRAFVIPIAGLLAVSTPASADPVADALWRARPVVLVAPSADDPRLLAQRRLLADKAAAVRNYDIEIIVVTGSDPARARWHVPVSSFAAILVGKDGGEKARWSAPVAPAEIFKLIDRMPMRRQEAGER